MQKIICRNKNNYYTGEPHMIIFNLEKPPSPRATPANLQTVALGDPFASQLFNLHTESVAWERLQGGITPSSAKPPGK